jgi:choline dehydrogenase-like flavoprotein
VVRGGRGGRLIIDGVSDGDTIAGDVCIVGGGPAGIALALRLARNPKARVCLLETGGLAYEPSSQALARADVVDTPYYPLHETRVRALGGSSWSWGGISTPLDAMAFESRPWVPGGGWPIRRAELVPYLDDALTLCGIEEEQRRRTDQDTAERFEAAGLDPALVAPVPVYFSRPLRFGPTYRGQLEALPNLRVYLHTTVTGLEANAGRIVEARASSRGRPVRITAGSYVLAGGGVENPRLLLASGVGGDATGRFFMEHPRVLNRYRIRRGDTPLGRLVGGGASGTLRFFRLSLSDAAQRAERLLTQHVNLQFGYAGQLSRQWPAVRRMVIATRPPWNESPFYQDAGGGRMRLRSADLVTAMRRPDLSFLSGIGAATERPFLRRFLEVWSAVEQEPDPRNHVELLAERDSLGVPRARVHWSVSGAEEQTYRTALRVLLGELDKVEPGIAGRSIDDGDPWPSQIVGNWHHEGTTRMSDDPAAGVVDRDCRVHGTDNLFVAGSSVFPVSGSTSPTVTILQLALRLADHLSGSLGD